MVLTFLDYEIIAGITNNFVDYKKIAGITNYFGVEFLKISFYLNLFVKMEFFRQKERIQVIKYIYLLKKKKIKTETETEAGAHLIYEDANLHRARVKHRKLTILFCVVAGYFSSHTSSCKTHDGSFNTKRIYSKHIKHSWKGKYFSLR